MKRLKETAALFVAVESFPDPQRIKIPLDKLVVAWKTLDDTEETLGTDPGRAQRKEQTDRFDQARRNLRRTTISCIQLWKRRSANLKMKSVIACSRLAWIILQVPLVITHAQELTVAQVEVAKARSDKHMMFKDLEFIGSSVHHSGFNLGIGNDAAETRYSLSGTDNSGRPASISFSEITSIRRVDANGARFELEITLFPEISPKDLILLAPNCEQLSKYRKTIRIIVNVSNGINSLQWLGSDDEYADVHRIGDVIKMQPGVTMRLGIPVNEAWWAVPSIRRDPLCVSVLDPLSNGTNLKPPEKK
jgi:hypothetical protein